MAAHQAVFQEEADWVKETGSGSAKGTGSAKGSGSGSAKAMDRWAWGHPPYS